MHGEGGHAAMIALSLHGRDHLLPQGSRGGQCDEDRRPFRCRHVDRVNLLEQIGIHAFIFVPVPESSVRVGDSAKRESETHSRKAVAFDTRTLQSFIRRFSEDSSTSLGVECGRACLEDSASFEPEAVRLRTADEGFSLRGEREAREGRRHNFVGTRKVFQKEGGIARRLTP